MPGVRQEFQQALGVQRVGEALDALALQAERPRHLGDRARLPGQLQLAQQAPARRRGAELARDAIPGGEHPRIQPEALEHQPRQCGAGGTVGGGGGIHRPTMES
jgi:hypothetical protein